MSHTPMGSDSSVTTNLLVITSLLSVLLMKAYQNANENNLIRSVISHVLFYYKAKIFKL